MRAYIKLFLIVFVSLFAIFIWVPFSFLALLLIVFLGALTITLTATAALPLIVQALLRSRPTSFSDEQIQVHVFENPARMVYRVFAPRWTGRSMTVFLSRGETEALSANELVLWLEEQKNKGTPSKSIFLKASAANLKPIRINAPNQFMALVVVLLRRRAFFQFRMARGKWAYELLRFIIVFLYLGWPENAEEILLVEAPQ